MSDKFPPKNSGFRLETFRFPSDVTPCRHAIYHHGCPSCDERDPEGDDNDLVVGAPTREDGDSPTGAGYTPTTDFVRRGYAAKKKTRIATAGTAGDLAA